MPAYQIDTNKEFISDLFRNRKENLKDLILAVGISHQTLLNIEEKGQSSRKTLKKIADYFKVDYSQLLAESKMVNTFYEIPKSKTVAKETNPIFARGKSFEGKLIREMVDTYVSAMEEKIAIYQEELKAKEKQIKTLKTELEKATH